MFGQRELRGVRRCVWLAVALTVWPASAPAATFDIERTASVFTGRFDAIASPVCESSPPLNIDPGPLREQFTALLQRSATFRRQCARIAATPALRVTLRVAASTGELFVRAQTVVDRFEGGAIRAEVTLRFSEDPLELLAHEFEHILEQIDGVVMRDEVARGRAWKGPSGAFETRRAADAGIRVRAEYRAAAAARSPHHSGR
jgi:hypothetical protein